MLLHWVDHEVHTIDINTLKEIEKFTHENLRKGEVTNPFTSLSNKIVSNKFIIRNQLNENINLKGVWQSQLPPYRFVLFFLTFLHF